MCSSVCFANVVLDEEESRNRNFSDRAALRQTQQALMGYEIVQQKTQYWSKRLEKTLFGEHAEKFMIIAPLVTGRVEFNAMDLNFYVNAREEESGVRYVYSF